MFLHEDVTDKIISCSYKVYNYLGSGFLEKVYENALKIELEERGIRVEQQVPLSVTYAGLQVGDILQIFLLIKRLF